MKKHIYFIAMASLFMFSAVQLNAQNRCVLQNDQGATRVIAYSDDMNAIWSNGQMATCVTSTKVKPQQKGMFSSFTLNVYPPEDVEWLYIFVIDGEDVVANHFNMMGDPLTVELNEGVYHVASGAFVPDEEGSLSCLWILDNLEITSDTNVYIDFDDCVYALNLDVQDENGQSMSEKEYIEVFYEVKLYWHHCVNFANFMLQGDFCEQVPKLRYNGFDESSSLFWAVSAEPGAQKSYFIACPTLVGLNESPTCTIVAEDMNLTNEWFNIQNNLVYYHLDYRTIMDENGEIDDEGGVSSRLLFDPNMPYTIVSNAKIEDPNNYDTGPKTILLPSVYERCDFGNSPYRNGRIGTSLYFNADGEKCRETMPFFRDASNPSPPSYPDYFPETPAMKVTPADKVVNFGERTPLATYYPLAVNADNTPLNQTILRGGFYFSGENSCERQCDYDSFIQVYVDGQEIYNDSICKFNRDLGVFQIDPAPVVVETNNQHLIANGVPKVNQTRVEFDLNRDDAMPPTMTFLRVLDGDGDETVCLDDLSQSTLEFGCGDYTYHYAEDEWGGYYDHLEYNAKPAVEVLYCAEGGDWQPLVVGEDVSLFHINYGNVFVADLSQLESRALNKWVSLKFMLEDAAGNTQEQTLENVFYSGHTISVDEYAAERLEHEVIPNPFTEEVRIKSAQPLDGVSRVQLYDVLGRRVYDATEKGRAVNEFIIDGSALKPGIYFYDINTEKGVMRGKIVK